MARRAALSHQILEFMAKANRPLTERELAAEVGGTGKGRSAFERTVMTLERTGRIVKTRAGRYALPERLNLVVGRIGATATGNGMVRSDDGHVIFVDGEEVGPAVDGDKVLVRVHRQARSGKRAEGAVIRVLSRRTDPVVGTYQKGVGAGFVVPDRELLHPSVVITGSGARHGDRVVVEITRFPEQRKDGIEGRVIEVLGATGEPGVDIMAAIRRLGLPDEYPEQVTAAAQRLPKSVTSSEIVGRLDLRGEFVVTIDGETAKDHDDAISISRRDDGYVLGVHIADVSHYVTPMSVLDREARQRGTSVYLVDRTLHMFPTELSQGIASLNAGQDRLAVSAHLEFDRTGALERYRFSRSVINVRHRLVYDRVSAALEGDPRAVAADVLPAAEIMSELAERLRERRRQRGSLEMDLPETVVTLDEQGRPIDVRPSERGIADRIIEEFMIAANEAVAHYLLSCGGPGVFRCHEPPDSDAVTALSETLGLLGFKLGGSPRKTRTFQKLLDRTVGRPEERLISQLVLRTMSKARYGAENTGHFGLASPAYTHFTSPIRRYPDLLVHRLLLRSIAGKASERFRTAQAEILPGLCDHCSAMEKKADDAERETTRLKVLEYMAGKIGEEYRGTVSGVAPYGFYVQLDNTAEGFVHVSSLVDDFYDYEEQRAALIGRRNKRQFRLGDPVNVWVEQIDPQRREVGLRVSEVQLPERPAGKTRGRSGGGRGR